MRKIELYFDGFCPECLLRGKEVEMKLNSDDFLECEETGLQMSVFPPFAPILRWRGKGQFLPAVDANSYLGLIMTETQHQEGKEFLPDEKNIIHSLIDLEFYLGEVCKNREEFEAAMFNPNDPVFEQQRLYLETVTGEEFDKFFQLYDQRPGAGGRTGAIISPVPKKGNERTASPVWAQDVPGWSGWFNKLHEAIYKLILVFDYNWMAWRSGWEDINNNNFDYSNCSLLELSMYLTAIFRADRFCDDTIKYYFNNGTLFNIFDALKRAVLRRKLHENINLN